jgi:DNA-directed RNA polymerase subunit omega
MLKSKVYLRMIHEGITRILLAQRLNMARITVEDCLRNVNNRFALIHMAAKRVRQLRKGAEPTVISKNRDVVVALREIAAGNVVEGEMLPQEDLLEPGSGMELLPEGDAASAENDAASDASTEEKSDGVEA